MTAPIVVRGDARALPLPDESVDAIVCDPPYELSFMGRSWDSTGVAFDTEPWREALRVLKPGGHLAAFGATRTYHRLGCAIEDAGFEVRDSIRAGVYAWVHGQGFPKSLNVAKEIDKRRFGSDDAAGFKAALAEAVAASGKSRKRINDECGFTMRFDIAYDRDPAGWGCSLPSVEQYDVICRVLGTGGVEGLAELREWPRTRLEKLYEVVGTDERWNEPSGIVGAGQGQRTRVTREITRPGTDAARTWDGWGTAATPATSCATCGPSTSRARVRGLLSPQARTAATTR